MKLEFVDFIPPDLMEGTIYVSIPFATVVHRCACGCSREVVTPLSPTDWRLSYDGESISLNPSIGNWGFECRSHYLITRNRVKWAGPMSHSEVEAGRRRDQWAKIRYFKGDQEMPAQEQRTAARGRDASLFKSLWTVLTDWWAR